MALRSIIGWPVIYLVIEDIQEVHVLLVQWLAA